MIAYVEGRIAEVTEQSCVVITNGGVGYELFVPAPTLAACSKNSEDIYFYVCTVVREDALELFGFETWDERETFLLLRTINRVGPRTALAILSIYKPDDLAGIVHNEDAMALSLVPGIGKKTAQQVFLELKYKIEGKPALAAAGGKAAPNSPMHDAIAGLMNLGYAEAESQDAVKKVLVQMPGLGVGEVLRQALKQLARGK